MRGRQCAGGLIYRELVIASTASNDTNFDAPVRMLNDYILPAIQ